VTPCTRCSTVNHPEAIFCARCGSPYQTPVKSCVLCNQALRADAGFCPRCGHRVDSAQIICSLCRTPNRKGANFCRHCRQPLTHTVVAAAIVDNCTVCGGVNNPGVRFCRHCGQPLPGQTAIQLSLIPCIHCGQGTRPGIRFCPYCGQPPTVAKQQVQQRYATGKLPSQSTLEGADGDEYLLVSLVAQGGMGAVYKVLRTRDSTIWALKEMSESVIPPAEREQTINGFHEEARLLQTVAHDNLPKVIDLFEHNHRHYMVMDFIEGQTLTELLLQRGGQLPEAEVAEWGKQLCIVLDYLHGYNPPIIYRDLKPDNVMIENSTNCVKLIDFGIARRFKSGKTSDTVHLGTSGYAPPEQYGKSGRQSNEQTDLYALGATLHHLLTGVDPAHHPFHFPDIRDQVQVSDDVAQAIMKAVKLKPEQRHASAAMMYKALSGQDLPAQKQPAGKVPSQAATVSGIPAQAGSVLSSSSLGTGSSVVPVLSLQFNGLRQGVLEKKSLPIHVSTGTLDVDTDVEWLNVDPDVVDHLTTEIEVTVDTTMLRLGYQRWAVAYQPNGAPGYLWWLVLWLTYAHAYYFVPVPEMHQGKVLVGQEQVDVLVEVTPSQAQVTAGWIFSSTAVIGELAGLGWLAWALLIGV
jgi:serine/threonine protein kinase